MNIGKSLVATALSVAMFASVGAGVYAAPGEHKNGYGGCVDNLYGNATSERPGGNGVLPSQAPGPWVNTGENEPPRNDRVRGISVGDVMKIGTANGLNGRETMEIICTFP